MRVRRDASRCSHVSYNMCRKHLGSSPSGVREEVALHCVRYDRDLQDTQVLVDRADRATTSLQTRGRISMRVFMVVSMGTHRSAVVSAFRRRPFVTNGDVWGGDGGRMPAAGAVR